METAYFKYLNTVLGVKSIVFNNNDLIQSEIETEYKLIILLEKDQLSPQGYDLLEKMLKAMEIEFSNICLFETDVKELLNDIEWIETSTPVLTFSENFYQLISKNFPKVSLFKTHSPDDLIKNPALKKTAWSVLQQIMQSLNRP